MVLLVVALVVVVSLWILTIADDVYLRLPPRLRPWSG